MCPFVGVIFHVPTGHDPFNHGRGRGSTGILDVLARRPLIAEVSHAATTSAPG